MRLHRPSPSMVVALAALTVALGGTSYAAIKLPKNSVGSKQIKKNAVTGSKVKDGSLFANDFASGQLPRGAKGDGGPQGPAGANGAAGPPGAAQVIVRRHAALVRVGPNAGNFVNLVTLQVPPGKWQVFGTTNGFYDLAGDVFRCYLLVDGSLVGETPQSVALGVQNGSTRGAVFAPEAAFATATTATVVMRCDHGGSAPAGQFGPDFGPSRLTAVRADNLDLADQ